LTVKIIQGVECCVERTEQETVEDLKTAVERELQIPVANQRLILKGKTLQDSSSIKEISVKDGDKVHLSVRKPTAVDVSSSEPEQQLTTKPKSLPPQQEPKQILETELRNVLRSHFRSEEDTSRIVNTVLRSIQRKLNNLSLDDIDRICSRFNKEKRLEF
jgi:hypothetical protein